MRSEDPLKILEIMRLWEEHELSQREIAASVNCAKSTVGEIQRRCKEYGLNHAEAKTMTNEEIKGVLYPVLAAKDIKEDPDWDEIHARLIARPKLNLRYIWEEEYRPKTPDGLSYSHFCRRYRKWGERSGKEVRMPRSRVPGRELFVDWAGDKLDLVYDPKTGEEKTAHFFVATLGDSNYPYAEAFPDEGEFSWLTAHIHALEWIGGVPRIAVPDNTKTAVTKSNYYDPVLNQAYAALGKHYDIGIVPARVRKPRDKSTVEGSVNWLETWLLEWLRGKRFFSFGELNKAIRARVAVLANRPFTERKGSRLSVFEEVDKPALRPLPQTRYEYVEYARRRVPDNYSVEYDGFYYSVPYALFGQHVTLRAGMAMIEIFNGNRERVALHQRAFSGAPSVYVTKKGHMPENHKHQHDFDRRDGDSYRTWAKQIGESVYGVIDALLKAQSIEETAYRSCMGVLQMSNRFGKKELERACEMALDAGRATYNAVKEIIGKPELPQLPDAKTPIHDNLRDPSEFR